MLNVFPIMFLSLLAHTILRVFVGGTLVYLGVRHATKDRTSLREQFVRSWPKLAGFFVWYIALVEIVVGIMFFVGAWTQIAALIAMLMSIKMIVLRKRLQHPAIPQPLFYVLLFAASLSLFITGAGALAFDLPL